MKPVLKFQSDDGREFATRELCEQHENLVKQIAILEELHLHGPQHKNIHNGWVQHDTKDVTAFKVAILKLAEPILGGPIREPEKVHPHSSVGRMIDDSGSILYAPWVRLMSIDEQGREHNQPYFAINGPDSSHACVADYTKK